MLKACIQHLNSFFQNKLISVLLFLGIMSCSIALTVYYITGLNNIESMSNIYKQNHIIEAEIDSPEQAIKLYEIIAADKIQNVGYANILTYKYDNFDVIGYYSPTDDFALFLSDEENSAAITANFHSKEYKVDQIITLHQNKYTIKRIFAESDYRALQYDFRRMNIDKQIFSGVASGFDENIANRLECGIILPFKTFLNSGYSPTYMHIYFNNSISDAQREKYETLLSNELGITVFTEFSSSAGIQAVIAAGNTVLYLAAALVGCINTFTLYGFMVRENRKQYLTYKLCGATDKNIYTITTAHILFISFAAFIFSIPISLAILNNESLLHTHSKVSLLRTMPVLLILILIPLIIGLYEAQIIIHTKKKKEKKAKDTAKFSIVNSQMGKMIYLISFKYNKSNIINTLSLILLSVITGFSFTYCSTYILESQKYNLYFKDYKSDNIGIVDYGVETFFNIYDSSFQAEADMTLTSPFIALEGKLSALGLPIGRIDNYIHSAGNNADIPGAFLYTVNETFIQHESVKLSQGDWIELLNYNNTDETAAIPCIISPALSDTYELGETFTRTVSFPTGIELLEGENGSYKLHETMDTVERDFVVAGIISSDAFVFSQAFSGGVSFPTADNYTTPIADEYGGGLSTIFIPAITNKGNTPFWTRLPRFLVYNTPNTTDATSNIAPYGYVTSLNDTVDNYYSAYMGGGGNIYMIHGIISAMLLIFGLASYNILTFSTQRNTFGVYFAYGMSWKYLIKMTALSNFTETAIPALVGALWGVLSSNNIRSFSYLTILRAVTFGLVVVSSIFLIVLIFSAIAINKNPPHKLIHEKS